MHLRKRRYTAEEPLEQAEETADTPEMNILREEQNLRLYEALSQLRAEYRQILILLYFEDMTHEEAGRVMEKNRKQIYNLADRARAALKKELERMGFEHAQYR
jgi:RNA polymerase sigma-70 factor (ECF subfamily)